MNIGKVPESILRRSILKRFQKKREDQIVGPSVGEDSAVIDFPSEEKLVLSSRPITGRVEELGSLAPILAANDLAAEGARPLGLMLNLMLPPSFSEAELRIFMADLQKTCERENMALFGGHTETMEELVYPLVCVTGVGAVREEDIIRTSAMEAGDDIILTKYAGIYGTAKLAAEREELLAGRYAKAFLEEAKAMREDISIVKEAQIAKAAGVKAMHDVSKGGVFAALWEMAEASNLGIEISLAKIPIRQHTVEVCEFFDINPYQMVSNGSLLIATKRGNELLEQLEKEKIPAAIIGKATKGRDRVVYYEEEKRFLERPRGDEAKI